MALPRSNTMQSERSANLRRTGTLVPVLVFLGAEVAFGQPDSSLGRSPRNANYTIQVRLDAEAKTLAGRQIVEWRNIQDRSTDELWLHLYWNAWRNNRSTWMLEDRIRERSDLGGVISETDWGWIEIEKILLCSEDGEEVDLGPSLRFAAPDDGNREDRTVAVVDLPEPVLPGASIKIEIFWRAKIPRTFARTGFRGDFFFIAHWFPKLGVFEGSGWNCHQYHASTEYFSDYGVYDVSITAPREFVIGATGTEVETVDAGDDTATHRFVQEDVHAFTWTASPDFIVLSDRFESAHLPGVDLTLLIQPEHLAQSERHFRATKVALDRYGRWYGPYPYPHLTIVDPAWGSGAGGMEYPTLFTAGTRIFNPFGGGSPESVTIHEAGHQFWYALVGNNEFEHAWLDEGINTFSTSRALVDEYGPRSYVHRFFAPIGTKAGGFLPLILEGFSYGRSIYGNRLGRYRSLATIDRQDTASFRYYPAAAGSLSYSKTALWLGTLERYSREASIRTLDRRISSRR
ncbi:MAG: M1 family metallopeptidase [Acidobacteriota bacterium]